MTETPRRVCVLKLPGDGNRTRTGGDPHRILSRIRQRVKCDETLIMFNRLPDFASIQEVKDYDCFSFVPGDKRATVSQRTATLLWESEPLRFLPHSEAYLVRVLPSIMQSYGPD